MFKPFWHEPSQQVLIDGGVYHNNPITIADKERKLLWPNLKNDHPDITVSLGTTCRSVEALNSDNRPQSKIDLGVISHGKSLIKLGLNYIASTRDSEKTWDSYIELLDPPSNHKHRYVRLNPRIDLEPPDLDDLDSMRYLKATARASFGEDGRIQQVANKLIASSFYFERSSPKLLTTDGAIQCSGTLWPKSSPTQIFIFSRAYILPIPS